MNVLQVAMRYKALGFSVLAVGEGKQPVCKWKPLQERVATDEELGVWFGKDKQARIGVVCGKVSGGLEVIDVDCKYDLHGTLYARLVAAIRQHDARLWAKMVTVRTVNGGYHIYYRCATVAGNMKLACRATTTDEQAKNPGDRTRVLIETRGEGGYVVAPPGKGYSFEQGLPGDVCVITAAERDVLLSAARGLDECNVKNVMECGNVMRGNVGDVKNVVECGGVEDTREREVVDNAGHVYPKNGYSVFDEYNDHGDVLCLLQAHGWKLVSESDEKVVMLRPGETSSVSSGDYNKRMGLFSVFTTSSVFIPNKGYKPSAVFTVLECDGDFRKAYQRLKKWRQNRGSRDGLRADRARKVQVAYDKGVFGTSPNPSKGGEQRSQEYNDKLLYTTPPLEGQGEVSAGHMQVSHITEAQGISRFTRNDGIDGVRAGACSDGVQGCDARPTEQPFGRATMRDSGASAGDNELPNHRESTLPSRCRSTPSLKTGKDVERKIGKDENDKETLNNTSSPVFRGGAEARGGGVDARREDVTPTANKTPPSCEGYRRSQATSTNLGEELCTDCQIQNPDNTSSPVFRGGAEARGGGVDARREDVIPTARKTPPSCEGYLRSQATSPNLGEELCTDCQIQNPDNTSSPVFRGGAEARGGGVDAQREDITPTANKTPPSCEGCRRSQATSPNLGEELLSSLSNEKPDNTSSPVFRGGAEARGGGVDTREGQTNTQEHHIIPNTVNHAPGKYGDEGLNTFWEVSDDGRKIALVRSRLESFLSSVGGFYLQRYAGKTSGLVRIQNGVVTVADSEVVKKFVKGYVLSLPEWFDGISRESLLELVYRSGASLFTDEFFEFLERKEIDFLKDTPTHAYFPFRNGVVCIDATGYELKTYAEVGKCVWERSVVDRGFEMDGAGPLRPLKGGLCGGANSDAVQECDARPTEQPFGRARMQDSGAGAGGKELSTVGKTPPSCEGCRRSQSTSPNLGEELLPSLSNENITTSSPPILGGVDCEALGARRGGKPLAKDDDNVSTPTASKTPPSCEGCRRSQATSTNLGEELLSSLSNEKPDNTSSPVFRGALQKHERSSAEARGGGVDSRGDVTPTASKTPPSCEGCRRSQATSPNLGEELCTDRLNNTTHNNLSSPPLEGPGEVSAEFYRFIKKICADDAQRIKHACALIGYLLHRYKDPTRPWAVVLCEEVASARSGGGAGKGILVKALGLLQRTEVMDGKNFKLDKSFAWQRVGLDTRLVAIEDARRGVDFEGMNSILTEGITVERKNRDEIYIPFADAPKFIFTTNYTIPANSNHAQRRMKVMEFSRFFHPGHRPDEYFGRQLFYGWDEAEWQRFYHFMCGCVMRYLRHGLPELSNSHSLKIKQTEQSFGEEFRVWWEGYANLKTKNEKEKTDTAAAYDWNFFSELYNGFLNENGYDKKDYSQRRFKKALEETAVLFGGEVVTRRNQRNNGNREIKIMPVTKPV